MKGASNNEATYKIAGAVGAHATAHGRIPIHTIVEAHRGIKRDRNMMVDGWWSKTLSAIERRERPGFRLEGLAAHPGRGEKMVGLVALERKPPSQSVVIHHLNIAGLQQS